MIHLKLAFRDKAELEYCDCKTVTTLLFPKPHDWSFTQRGGISFPTQWIWASLVIYLSKKMWCDSVSDLSLGPKRQVIPFLAPMQVYWCHVNKHSLVCWVVRHMKQSSPNPAYTEPTARCLRLTSSTKTPTELLCLQLNADMRVQPLPA